MEPNECAKVRVLLDDLGALRVKEPCLHAVVFTHHQTTYNLLTAVLRAHHYTVCGFKGGDKPQDRHATIRAFQASVDATKASCGCASSSNAKMPKSEAKVFVATMKVINSRERVRDTRLLRQALWLLPAVWLLLDAYCASPTPTPKPHPVRLSFVSQVGNVGITLTAATRVYLFEPCLDPQMEMQAAGRIHRLGQTKDVLVKRLVYRASIEVTLWTRFPAVQLHQACRWRHPTAAFQPPFVAGCHPRAPRADQGRERIHRRWHLPRRRH